MECCNVPAEQMERCTTGIRRNWGVEIKTPVVTLKKSFRFTQDQATKTETVTLIHIFMVFTVGVKNLCQRWHLASSHVVVEDADTREWYTKNSFLPLSPFLFHLY